MKLAIAFVLLAMCGLTMHYAVQASEAKRIAARAIWQAKMVAKSCEEPTQ